MIHTELFENDIILSKTQSEYLMIVLHGKGDSLAPFKKFNEELGLYDINYLLLNAPKKYLDGRSWYGDPPYQKQGVLRIRQQMFRLLDDLRNQGWDPSKIFLFGFSQGCLISTDVALHYPYKLGGVVGVSGYFQFDARWKKQIEKKSLKTPWFLTHGTADDVLPIENTKFGVQKLREVGLNIDWIETDKKHVMEEDQYPIIRQWVKNQMSSL